MTRVEYRKLSMYKKLLLLQEMVDSLQISDKEHRTVSGMVSECIYTTSEYMRGTTDRKRLSNISRARERVKESIVPQQVVPKTRKERRLEASKVANELLSKYNW